MAVRRAMPGVIRKICLWCQGGSARLVKECAHARCPLHSCRMVEDEDNAILLSRIAAFCLACAGSADAVFECTADVPIGGQPSCPAHPYRIHEQAPAQQQATLAQKVRPLPGLGEDEVRQDERGSADQDGSSAPADAAHSGALTVPLARNPARHDAQACVCSGRAPQALDI
jgi:hypothetical protein